MSFSSQPPTFLTDVLPASIFNMQYYNISLKDLSSLAEALVQSAATMHVWRKLAACRPW